MSSIKALSYTYRWEIIQSIVFPSSIFLTCYFQNRWVKDGHTNYSGIICATVINTATYVWLNRMIRKKWVDHWENIRKEASRESQEAASVRESHERAVKAHLALEQSHTDIRENKHQLEIATKDKKDKFEKSTAAHTSAETSKRRARAVRDSLINNKLIPAFTCLKTTEIEQLNVEETKPNSEQKMVVLNM